MQYTIKRFEHKGESYRLIVFEDGSTRVEYEAPRNSDRWKTSMNQLLRPQED